MVLPPLISEPAAGSTILVDPAAGLHAYSWGDDRDLTPVLFVHPVNTSARVWARVASQLAPRICVAVDLRGHGLSSGAPGPYRIDDYAGDAIRAADAAGLSEMHVVGGSLGGPISVVLAGTHPERVRSITSLGGSLVLSPDPDALAALVDELAAKGPERFWTDYAPGILGSGHPPSVAEELVSIASERPIETIAAIIEGAFTTDIRDRAGLVQCPALVVNGGHDPTCTPEMGRAMAASVNGRYVELAHLGHLPMLEAPGMVTSLLLRQFALAESGPT